MNSIKLHVKIEKHKYPILIGNNILNQIQKLLKENLINFNQCLVIADKNIPKEWGKIIADARQIKKWKQKDLAQKINEQPTIINQYECGKAIIDHKIIGKIERVLNIKLRNKKK